MPANRGSDTSYRPIYDRDELSDAERHYLDNLFGEDASFTALVRSDLLTTGRYGESLLVLMGGEVVAIEEGEVRHRLALSELDVAQCRRNVGNGQVVVRLHDGSRVELLRFSQTMADAFDEITERINEALNLGVEDVEARHEEMPTSGRGDSGEASFRCPSCGYPLKHAEDACPTCASKTQMLSRLFSYVKDEKKLFLVGIGLSLLVTVANLGPGFLVRLLVDLSLNPSEGADLSLGERQLNLVLIVATFAGLMIMRLVAQSYQIKIIGTLGERVVHELRGSIFKALQRLSLNYYDREHTGRIMARVTSDTRHVQMFIVRGMQQLVTNGMLVIGITAILLLQDIKMALIALLPIPIVVFMARRFSKKFKAIYKSVRRRFATLSATVSDSVSGVRVVKAFGQEHREIEGFQQANQDCYDAHLTALQSRARFNPLVIFLMGIGTIIVWLVGGREVLAGALTLGVLLQFVTYMNMFRAPVQQLMNLTEIFQRSATAAERIFNILDKPADVRDHDEAIELEEVKGGIDVEDVSFSYEEGERVLSHINLHVEPGEMIGLVGETGSGKSTLASLVCRFYDPSRGRITLDGHDLRDIRIHWLRQHIGMVLQDPFIFAGTLRENIAYGRPDATDAEIINAAIAANAHEFVINLPDGYDSQVGERGVGLSGGEKQRISIARAILKDPAILILDEATSAVDTATEAIIQEAMDRLVQGRTTIAIAHRLSTLRSADRLIVMQEGAIIEAGSHHELLERGGMYATLCRIQADFAEDVDNATEQLELARHGS